MKIKKEPVDENEKTALVKQEQPMHPDEYLKSEYEKHKKALAEQSNSTRNTSNRPDGLFGRMIEGGARGKEVAEVEETDKAKRIDKAKEYFFELHIKQLEEKLEQARIREAERNVKIGTLKAQVDMLREPSTHGYRAAGSIVSSLFTESSDTPNRDPHPFRSLDAAKKSEKAQSQVEAEQIRAKGKQVLGKLQREKGPEEQQKQQIDVREQIWANRQQVNNGNQVNAPTQFNSQTRGNGQVQAIDRLQKHSELAQHKLGGRQSQSNSAQVNNSNRGHGQAQISVQPCSNDQAQVNGQAPANTIPAGVNNNRVNTQPRQVTPERGDSKDKLLHIAAITFTAPLVATVSKLKYALCNALLASPLQIWFDRQVKYTFQCAGEPDFPKMVTGFRDFVDFVGMELHNSGGTEVKEIVEALKECEDMVRVVMDAEDMILQ